MIIAVKEGNDIAFNEELSKSFDNITKFQGRLQEIIDSLQSDA
jgi:hypothetical protein